MGPVVDELALLEGSSRKGENSIHVHHNLVTFCMPRVRAFVGNRHSAEGTFPLPSTIQHFQGFPASSPLTIFLSPSHFCGFFQCDFDQLEVTVQG